MSIFCFCFRTFHTHFGICYLLNGQMNPFSRVQLYVFSLLPRVLMISPVLKLLIVSHTDQYQKLSFKKKNAKNRVFILFSLSPWSAVSSRNSKKLVRPDLPLFLLFFL